MSRIAFIFLFVTILSVTCKSLPVEIHDNQNVANNNQEKDEKHVQIDLSQSKKNVEPEKPIQENVVPNPDTKQKSNPEENEKPKDKSNNEKSKTASGTVAANESTKDSEYHTNLNHNVTEMDSSTLKRLVLVLVAFSIMFILYLAFKTYRRRNRRSHVMVSKYGVRTRRSDVEMRPLPLLEEDEEDETVFDVGNVTR